MHCQSCDFYVLVQVYTTNLCVEEHHSEKLQAHQHLHSILFIYTLMLLSLGLKSTHEHKCFAHTDSIHNTVAKASTLTHVVNLQNIILVQAYAKVIKKIDLGLRKEIHQKQREFSCTGKRLGVMYLSSVWANYNHR